MLIICYWYLGYLIVVGLDKIGVGKEEVYQYTIYRGCYMESGNFDFYKVWYPGFLTVQETMKYAEEVCQLWALDS